MDDVVAKQCAALSKNMVSISQMVQANGTINRDYRELLNGTLDDCSTRFREAEVYLELLQTVMAQGYGGNVRQFESMVDRSGDLYRLLDHAMLLSDIITPEMAQQILESDGPVKELLDIIRLVVTGENKKKYKKYMKELGMRPRPAGYLKDYLSVELPPKDFLGDRMMIVMQVMEDFYSMLADLDSREADIHRRVSDRLLSLGDHLEVFKTTGKEPELSNLQVGNFLCDIRKG